jgi:2-dehydro-3-deoxyphosphooctonate aldolase (KDO 8-P synthase)
MKVGAAEVGPGHPLLLIAGPCVIEGEAQTLVAAGKVADVAQRRGLPAVFKCSFDKANRTSGKSFRGPGLKEGLRVLARVKHDVGIPVLTDVHEPSQCAPVAEVVDVLQIPAFLSRQTDLILAAAKSGKAVNVKKGQFLAPQDARNIVDKAREVGCEKLMLTERGASFGYHNLVVDMRSFPIMRSFGVPVVFDVTHSLQLPGGLGHATGGQSEYIEPLARAGVACGVDAVFMEVHDCPEKALSDGPNALPLHRLAPLLSMIRDIHQLVNNSSPGDPR